MMVVDRQQRTPSLPSSLPPNQHDDEPPLPQSPSWRKAGAVPSMLSPKKDRRRNGGGRGGGAGSGAAAAVVLTLPLKDRLSLFRARRYHSWRSGSSTASTPPTPPPPPPSSSSSAHPVTTQVTREGEGHVGGGEDAALGQSSRRGGWGGGGRSSNNPSIRTFDVREEELLLVPGVVRAPAAAAAELDAAAAQASTSPPASTSLLPPIVEGATVMATPESRRIMRHISGLGMEDPALLAAASNHSQTKHSRRGPSTSTNDHDDHETLPVFQDMTIEDMPNDIRTTLSVESDPTATLSDGGGNSDLLDMELFHSSLGYITGWVPTLTTTTTHDDDDNGNEEDHMADTSANKMAKTGGSSSKTKKRSSSSSPRRAGRRGMLDPPDTEKLLLDLPCDNDNDDDKVNYVVDTDRKSTSACGVHNSPNAVVNASMIEQALLGASLNSLQSLSLDEIQLHSSMNQFPNPGVFLGKPIATTAKDLSTLAVNPAPTAALLAPSSPRSHSRRQPVPHPSPQHLTAAGKIIHNSATSRLHQSMPMNVTLGSRPSSSSKPEFKAPPSVSSLASPKRPSTSAGKTLKVEGTQMSKSSSHSNPNKLSSAAEGGVLPPSSSSTRKGAVAAAAAEVIVVIPKKRALPSIQCLFPDDSSPPPPPPPPSAPHHHHVHSANSSSSGASHTSGLASC